MAPYCSICSYMQPTGSKKRVYHRHFSAREVRHTQGVDFTPEYYGRNYMCPTCMLIHSTRPDKGLNVCLGDSLLHEVHRPLNPSVTCPADPFHIDWVTISGGTITDLTDAFIHDYKNQVRPMRVFVSAGLNDLIRGADKDLVIGRFIRLSEVINEQNCCHPPVKNELVIATLLTPPKLVWFEDNGTPPPTTKIISRSSRILILGSLSSTTRMAESSPRGLTGLESGVGRGGIARLVNWLVTSNTS